MASPRRETDSALEDHRSQRGGAGLNGHTKWAVGLVMTALIAAAAYGISNATTQLERVVSQQNQMAVDMATVKAEVVGLRNDVNRLENKP